MSGPNLIKSTDRKATKQLPRHSSAQASVAAPPTLESNILGIQQMIGNRAVSRLFQSEGQFPDQALRLQTLAGELEKSRPVANNANLFEIQLDTKVIQVTQQELEDARTQFREILNTGIQRVLKGPIANGRFKHEDASKLREEQKIVASISSGVGRVFGGEGFPELAIWDGPVNTLAQARSALNNNKLSEAASNLIIAEQTALEADRQVTAYQKGTVAGAEASQITLEIVRDVSLGVSSTLATIATGGAAGAVIGAGITATTNLAQQASETFIGLRKEIDFAGIGFDAIAGMITSKLSSKLVGDTIVSKLVSNPQFATLGQRITAKAIADLFEGRASTILNATASTLFNNFRGTGKKASLQEFLNDLADQLLDPQSIFMDLLTGQISSGIENKLSPIPSQPELSPNMSQVDVRAKTKVEPEAAGVREQEKRQPRQELPAKVEQPAELGSQHAGGRPRRASTRAFLKDALKKIDNPNHPLHFLVVPRQEPNGQVTSDWRKTTRVTKSGKKQTGRFPGGEEGPIIHVGHQGTFAAGTSQKFMLEDADLNVLGGQTIESRGALSFKTAVVIEGVPVDLATALQWERLKLLPPGIVARSPKIEPPRQP